jgi:hypothetical protein
MLSSNAKAPSYAELRPFLSKPTSDTFPVYEDLVDELVGARKHPNDTAAHILATASGYAYSSPETVATIMARMGLAENRCRMIAENVDSMFICSTAFLVQSEDGRVVVLAYRGTEPANLINWLTDADLYPDRIEIPVGEAEGMFAVHEGFYRNVRATKYAILSVLKDALEGKSVTGDRDTGKMEALYITGHSLGAAMAALMAIMLVTDPTYEVLAKKLRAVYTLGQPMIGSPELARACTEHEFLSENVLRYIYRRDIVAHLPPKESGHFAHFGREFRYDHPDEFPWGERDPERWAEQTTIYGILEAPLAFVARSVPRLRNLPFQFSLDDHGPQHYISRLTRPGRPTEFGDYSLERAPVPEAAGTAGARTD